jgi:hypothetical protein
MLRQKRLQWRRRESKARTLAVLRAFSRPLDADSRSCDGPRQTTGERSCGSPVTTVTAGSPQLVRPRKYTRVRFSLNTLAA